MTLAGKRFGGLTLGAGLLACFGWAAPVSGAIQLSDAKEAFRAGKYSECFLLCEEALEENWRGQEWSLLQTRAYWTVGKYAEAQRAVTNGLARSRSSIRLRVLAHEVFTGTGHPEVAEKCLQEVNELASARSMEYADASELVAFGRAALLLGADAKLVLERFYDRAKKKEADDPEAYLATGELALEKHDYRLAAKTYSEALKKFPLEPAFLCGHAQACGPSDRESALKSLSKALELNPRHPPSLLLLAELAINAEDYKGAEELLGKVLAVNPSHPEVWALRAVVRELEGNPAAAAAARNEALRVWARNPRVDHLIGLKLSQKYRFAEGAACQRAALGFLPSYVPAKIQLAQDLLRLGVEAEGWQLAAEVHKQDGYDVTAFNLVTLRDKLTGFRTLTNADFVVRMSNQEAALYGEKVLELLTQAKSRLGQDYQVNVATPTMVEIFPEAGDFGVRTFGMPDNPGYLGVCFGRVITANSPAAQGGSPANWQAVLWHEMCHVVTLQLTRNRMPRWLSEGISVFEEKRAHPGWGQAMTPKYRRLIDEGKLTPISQLSAAFLTAKEDLQLQFAYFESGLAVEFLVERFGRENLLRILRDLGGGTNVNQAIAASTAPLAQIDRDFAAFARERVRHLAPALDWKQPAWRTPPADARALGALLEQAPTNYWTLTAYARALLEEQQYAAAETPARKLVELYPDDIAPDNGRRLLAAALRGQRKTAEEQEALRQLAARDVDDLETFQRLAELASSAKDWATARRAAERALAVNPLIPWPYRVLATATEALGDWPAARYAWERVVRLDPPDPADAHYRLARVLRQLGDPAAKRQVLEALQEAPRFRAAHELLLELVKPPAQTNTVRGTAGAAARAQPAS